MVLNTRSRSVRPKRAVDIKSRCSCNCDDIQNESTKQQTRKSGTPNKLTEKNKKKGYNASLLDKKQEPFVSEKTGENTKSKSAKQSKHETDRYECKEQNQTVSKKCSVLLTTVSERIVQQKNASQVEMNLRKPRRAKQSQSKKEVLEEQLIEEKPQKPGRNKLKSAEENLPSLLNKLSEKNQKKTVKAKDSFLEEKQGSSMSEKTHKNAKSKSTKQSLKQKAISEKVPSCKEQNQPVFAKCRVLLTPVPDEIVQTKIPTQIEINPRQSRRVVQNTTKKTKEKEETRAGNKEQKELTETSKVELIPRKSRRVIIAEKLEEEGLTEEIIQVPQIERIPRTSRRVYQNITNKTTEKEEQVTAEKLEEEITQIKSAPQLETIPRKSRRVNQNQAQKTKEQEETPQEQVIDEKSNKTGHKEVEINKSNKSHTVKKTEIIPKKSLPAAKLRHRKTVNYAESSLEISKNTDNDNITKKVPVYLQQINNDNEPKQQEDTYEFDSDSEKQKKKKKRKINNSSSDEYNKTIENILKNVRTKIKRKRNNLQPKKRNNNNKVKQIIPTIAKIDKPPLDKNNIKINNNVLKEAPIITAPKEVIENLNPIESDDDICNDDFEACFGFNKVENEKQNSPKIKIISNVQLKPSNELNLSIATPSKFKEGRPTANSTMLNVLTPWRFNEINIKRNPHFITLKESSLPCINQEMVLDHTVVDKFEDHTRDHSKVEIEDLVKKTPIQKRLTDYFDNNIANKENSQVSLFDNDLLSPIKSKSRFNGKIDSIKRRVLGEINDNVSINQVHASTPRHNETDLRLPVLDQTSEQFDLHHENKQSTKDITNFGFSSLDEDSNRQETEKKGKDDKPFRLSINVNDKKYSRKRPIRKIEKAETVVASDDESAVSDPSDLESHSGEIRLFEDFNDTYGDDAQLSKISKRRRKRKWMNDNGENLYHKKRKDMRTKEEEEEAEKWAAAFNSMCEEIEEFPLEIE